MINFANPQYIFLLLLIPVFFIIYGIGRRVRRRRISRMGDPGLVESLMPSRSRVKGWVRMVLFSAAFFFFVIGLMRPQIGARLKEQEKSGAEIMIALDVSNSMLAEDYTPNRLERAKLSISSLVDRLRDDRIGLVIFAGTSFVQLPITARILYLYPSTTSIELINTIANSRTFLPYFDMPIQHISDSMLKIMNRGANRATHEKLINAMNTIQGRFMRTSLIIGHPGESEEDFKELCAFVKQSPFDRINIFEYSPQEDTKSFTLPTIESKIITKRINTINKILQKEQRASLRAMVGQTIEVIVEGVSDVSEYFYSARPRLWAREIDGEILINDTEDGLGEIKQGAYVCQITQVQDDFVFGKLLALA